MTHPGTIAVKFLIRKRGRNSPAHLWTGHDTVCRMYSTGGMAKKAYAVHETDCGRRICSMCAALSAANTSSSDGTADRAVGPSRHPIPETEQLPPLDAGCADSGASGRVGDVEFSSFKPQSSPAPVGASK